MAAVGDEDISAARAAATTGIDESSALI